LNIITPHEVRAWFASATDEDIQDFLDNGLTETIECLEQDDFFGTEGFDKRFA
jgi:hypothetical protein